MTSGTVVLPELPRIYVDTSMPTQTGQTITVASGGNLQTALNNAQPGDTIVLEAGATFTGNFILPTKSNPNNKWIIIKSSKENLLPPQGVRVSVADAINMPKITTSNATAPLTTAVGANGWRLIGLEITIPSTFTSTNYGLLVLSGGSSQTSLSAAPFNIVVDRNYIHGQPTVTVRRCVVLDAGSAAIIDSAITECHEKGADSQAIWGYNGPGPYKISNNLLEGAGENVMFGGADPRIPNLVPSDIEITRNYFHTPVAWMGTGSGTLWTKKNLFEIKNGERILVEGNIFDGSWTDGQTGGGILLRSANQSGGCMWCRGTNITFRRNLIKNVSAGIGIAGDSNVTTPAERIHIIENVIEAGLYSGNRRGFQIAGVASNGQRAKHVTFDRNVLSVAPGGSLQSSALIEGGTVCTFRDNVWDRGQYGFIGSGSGGLNTLNQYCGANGWIWSNMTLVGASLSTTANPYPQGTTWVSSESSAPLAAQIRAIVASATSGAVSGNWTGSTTPPPSSAPTLTLSASPSSINVGQSSTLAWSSTDATSCSASGSWTGTKATSGSQTLTPTANATYTLSCTGAGGTATQSVTVTITTTTAPTLTLTASPTSITSGQSSTITWSTTNATSCTANTGWSGTKTTSGSQTVNPAVSTTYDLTCTGAGGSVSRSVTISVATTTPTPTPTPTPTNNFTLGSAVMTTSNLNVRATAGGTILGTQSIGAKGTVLGGPVFNGEGYWWNINYINAPDGWSYDGFLVADEMTSYPPAPTPEPTPTPTLKFVIGDSLKTLDSVNVRSSASLTGTLLGTQATGQYGKVISGPLTSDGYVWWQIDYVNAPDGWSVQDYLAYVSSIPSAPAPEPELIPPPPPGIQVGDWVEPTDKINIRLQPTTIGKPLGKQSVGSKGLVIGGPISGQGYTWWKVDFQSGVDGWAVGNFMKETTAPDTAQVLEGGTSSGSVIFTDGQEVQTTTGVNVRLSASISATILGEQAMGAVGTVIDGPSLSGSYTWWKINFISGVDGWVTGNSLKAR